MQRDSRVMTIESHKREIPIAVDSVLYVMMRRNIAEIHMADGTVYYTRLTLKELAKALGDGFIRVQRGCLVSAMAVRRVTDRLILCSGETLDYSLRRRADIEKELKEKQRQAIRNICDDAVPKSYEAYREHYRSFETLPIAFTDIEIVYDDERNAVDWIFRYANEALAKLEEVPLEMIIGRSFGSLFPNMDAKWLTYYERAAVYGESLKVIDYSPEIDKFLDVMCFPTFRGHCGCILYDINEMTFDGDIGAKQKALLLCISKMLGNAGH